MIKPEKPYEEGIGYKLSKGPIYFALLKSMQKKPMRHIREYLKLLLKGKRSRMMIAEVYVDSAVSM